ncbi:Zn-ribbon domain-containing OB-fold protein [Pseudalkalibacillus sp. A8]|uniref:Zn-ribbon domain-containing OB-fold protein n=1 Tax=Pseudalkalibacillus sp. A8 TaxID=3382641 RepID=UPI0038B6861E
MSLSEMKKPTPVVDEDSKIFWQSCKDKKLMIQQCDECYEYIFYPRIICPYCTSEKISWVESQGIGTVYSYTIVRKPVSPAFTKDVPYVVAMVELNEGVRMMTHIINVDIEKVQCGMKVKVTFVDEEGFIYPKFEPRYA